jgi:hypothetical protein
MTFDIFLVVYTLQLLRKYSNAFSVRRAVEGKISEMGGVYVKDGRPEH